MVVSEGHLKLQKSCRSLLDTFDSLKVSESTSRLSPLHESMRDWYSGLKSATHGEDLGTAHATVGLRHICQGRPILEGDSSYVRPSL